MPVDVTVTNGTLPNSNVNVGANMQDVPPGVKKDFDAHVVFTADPALVTFKNATPTPFKTAVTSKEITVWWKHSFKAGKSKHPFSVELACKRNAFGPTPYAWTVTSLHPNYASFGGCAGLIYHDPSHCNRKGRRP